MGRQFFVSGFRDDRWVTDEIEERSSNRRNQELEKIPTVKRPLLGPDGRQVVDALGRPRYIYDKPGAFSWRSEDVHYRGDRVVIRGTEVDERAGVTRTYFSRVGNDGRVESGTYELTEERTGERQHTNARVRKIFSF